MTHNSEQGINNVDDSGDASESQSIDINSTNLNKHVPNDCESLLIEINQISVSHSHDGIIQNHDQPLSVPLAQQDIMDDMSLTPTYVSNQDTHNIDNSSDFNESQSIDINSINLNNHASNNRESPSGSDNIATRVRARNAKPRQKKIHKKSQHFTARNRDNTSSSESLSYEY